MSDDLIQWVVYAPGPQQLSHLALEVAITGDGPVATGRHAVGDLDLVRRYLMEHEGLCIRWIRDPTDDPSIVETWM